MSFKPGQRGKHRSDPFAMLERSHTRLQDVLSQLLGAAAALHDDAHDADARARVGEIANFLEHSVARHERDEEESLFPRVREQFAQIVDTLEAEHRSQQALHHELRALATACDRDELDATLLAHLSDLAMTLAKSYSHHIEIEELELFPKARAALDATAKRALAAEMQARRGR